MEYERRKKAISKIRHRRLGKNQIECEDVEIEESDSDDDWDYKDSDFDIFREHDKNCSWLMNDHESSYVCGKSFEYDPFKSICSTIPFESIWTGCLYIPGGSKDWNEVCW